MIDNIRALRAILALAVFVSLLILPLDHADAKSTQSDAPIAVLRNEAVSDFPNGLLLNLEAESDRRIERIELLYRAADRETLNLEIPRFERGKTVELRHELDFRVRFQPSGIDITYFWRLTDDQDRVVETEKQTLLWYDNRFEWEAESSADVTVYSYRDNPAFARIVVESAQSTVDRLKQEFELDSVRPIRIWVYNTGKDFASAQQGNSSEWIAGTAYPQLQVILAVLPEGNQHEVGRVVPHEIAHQMLYQATENPFNAPPTWLDEGLAVRIQETGNEDDQAMVENAAEKGQLFSVRALNSNFPYDPTDTALAYAESFSIVSFLIEEFGEEKFADLIAAYRTGVSHDEAMVAALGFNLDELDRLWKESLGYQGDQPRNSGNTEYTEGSRWTPVLGPGLATGTLILFVALVIVAVSRIMSNRRDRFQSMSDD